MPHLTSKPEFPLVLPSKFNLKQPFGRASHLSVGLEATMRYGMDMAGTQHGYKRDMDSHIKTEVLDMTPFVKGVNRRTSQEITHPS